MKAAVFKDVKKIEYIEDYPKPDIGPNDVLVKVHYCGICGSDIVNFKERLYQVPIIMGHELIGEIVELGKSVTDFKIGDKVLGINVKLDITSKQLLGLGIFIDGGFAEFVKIPKQFLNLAGKPIIVHTVSKFITSPSITGGVIVSSEEDIQKLKDILHLLDGFSEKFKIVTGGKERQDSVYKGLNHLSDKTDIVLVHDGVRPLVTEDIIQRCITGAQRIKACIAAIPAKDTIKQVENGKIVATLPRNEIRLAQTPQAFEYEILIKAHKKAKQENYYSTDEAALVEWFGTDVYHVKGSEQNIKITTIEDLKVAEQYLQEMEK